MTFPTGAAQYTVSRTGALAYIGGEATAGAEQVLRTLVWVDRRGHEETVAAPPRSYVSLKLSPDGTTIALDARDQENDIWTFDIARHTLTRLTTDRGVDGFPLWIPDGRRIIFESNRTGSFNLYSQAADGTGVAEQLTKSQNQVWPYSISPDGTRAVLNESGGNKKNSDLDVLVLDGKSRLEPLIQSPFNKGSAAISPDGRWLAYNSDESGQRQVYVRPFPNVNEGQWPVSAAGGSKPVWAPSGKELFYLVGNQTRNTLMVVPVQTTPTFRPGNATKLFEGPYTSLLSGHSYDVSRDGQKFLMIKESPAAVGSAASPAKIMVVLNWIEELKARMPTK
jgi:serine/threonine-protein kinase